MSNARRHPRGGANQDACPNGKPIEEAFARFFGAPRHAKSCRLVTKQEMHDVVQNHGWSNAGGVIGFHTPDDHLLVLRQTPWSVIHEYAHLWITDDHLAKWICEAATEVASEHLACQQDFDHNPTYPEYRDAFSQHLAPAAATDVLELARIAGSAPHPARAIAAKIEANPRWRGPKGHRLLRSLDQGSGDEPEIFLGLLYKGRGA